MAILSKISWLLPQLALNQQKIATFILEQPQAVLLLSSQQIAEQIGVSQSAIVKFSQKVGVKGFPALKLAISEELGRKQVLTERSHKVIHNQIASNDSLMVIAQKLAQEKIDSVMETTRRINYPIFNKVATLVNNAQRVQIIGIGGSGLVAKDLYYKLQKIGITTLVDLDHHVQMTTALTLTAKDIQIAISFSGKRKNIYEAAAIAKQHGAKVIAIVGNKQQTPLVKLADYVLESVAGENEWRSSSISSRAAQNTLTDLLFLALLQKREEGARSLIINARLMINKLDE